MASNILRRTAHLTCLRAVSRLAVFVCGVREQMPLSGIHGASSGGDRCLNLGAGYHGKGFDTAFTEAFR